VSPAIFVLAEGATEMAFKERLKRFLDDLAGDKPKVRLNIKPAGGKVDKKEVKSRVPRYLSDDDCVGVIALTDVYPFYRDADEAKATLRSWMPDDKRCHAHTALHDFEAWLLSDWNAVLTLANIKNKKQWGANPESINLTKPPAHRLDELFNREATPRQKYSKVVQGKILMDKLDLVEAANKCTELKAFLNTLLKIAGYEQLQ
jgi:hypothetical protein